MHILKFNQKKSIRFMKILLLIKIEVKEMIFHLKKESSKSRNAMPIYVTLKNWR